MLRLIAFFGVIAAAAAGLAWLADRPGSIEIDWQGYVVVISVFHAVVGLILLLCATLILWSILRGVWQSPAAIGNFFNRRREKRGLEALSSGMIAIGAGDKALATRYAVQARKSLPNEPMTHLLRAQAARLAGDTGTSRRIFEAMLSSPDTEQLGLRGLFLEAEKEGEREAARQFAERAVKLNPKLNWPVEALFDLQCREGDWNEALETLKVARKNGHIEKPTADRRRAVLLTAQAQKAEDSDPERAMNLALDAHNLAPDLIPAAAIAGRMLSARGNTSKAVKVIKKTWRKSPHPDLAVAYAYARLGDSPKDRLERVAQLAALSPNQIESPIALANAAIEAKDYGAARKALEPLLESRLTQRVCTLMARIEGEETANAGAVREWLARAVHAPRDPAWTADGIVSQDWAAVSPVSGALDAFQWRVPVEAIEPRDSDLLSQKIEELVKLGVRPETMLAASPSAESQVAQPANVEPAPSARSATQLSDVPNRQTATDAEVVDAVEAKPHSPTPAPDNSKVTNETEPTSVPSGETVALAKIQPIKKVVTVGQDIKAANDANGTSVETSAPEGSRDAVAAAPVPQAAVSPPTEANTAKLDRTETPAPRETPDADSVAVAAVKPVAESVEVKRVSTPENVPAPTDKSAKVDVPEPKIFVSPRAPDDPGPKPESAKRR